MSFVSVHACAHVRLVEACQLRMCLATFEAFVQVAMSTAQPEAHLTDPAPGRAGRVCSAVAV